MKEAWTSYRFRPLTGRQFKSHDIQILRPTLEISVSRVLILTRVLWPRDGTARIQVVPKTCVDGIHQIPRLEQRIIKVRQKLVGSGCKRFVTARTKRRRIR